MPQFSIRTPLEISPVILMASSELSAGHQPYYLEITSGKDDKFLDCHNNVSRKIATEGGSQLFGWVFWEAPEMWIEAEFHSIFVSPLGEQIDLTPDKEGMTRRLFLPDPTKEWSPELDHPKRYWPYHDKFRSACRLYEEAARIAAVTPTGTPYPKRYVELVTHAEILRDEAM